MSIFLLSLFFITPKFILLSKEELFFTRAISKKEIYWYSFLTQGVFIFWLFSLILTALNLGAYLEFNYLSLFLITSWFYLTGEIGVITLSILFMLDVSSLIMSNSMSSYQNAYSVSFFISLENNSYSSLFIWLLALAIRFFDYHWYYNKEMGLFKGFYNTLKNLSKLYIPSLIISAIAIPIIFYFNPFIRFLNMPNIDQYESIVNNLSIVEAIFYKNQNQKNYNYYDKSTEEFMNLINNPYSEKAYLNLSTKYLEDWFSNNTFNVFFLQGLKKDEKNKRLFRFKKVPTVNKNLLINFYRLKANKHVNKILFLGKSINSL